MFSVAARSTFFLGGILKGLNRFVCEGGLWVRGKAASISEMRGVIVPRQRFALSELSPTLEHPQTKQFSFSV